MEMISQKEVDRLKAEGIDIETTKPPKPKPKAPASRKKVARKPVAQKESIDLETSNRIIKHLREMITTMEDGMRPHPYRLIIHRDENDLMTQVDAIPIDQ